MLLLFLPDQPSSVGLQEKLEICDLLAYGHAVIRVPDHDALFLHFHDLRVGMDIQVLIKRLFEAGGRES